MSNKSFQDWLESKSAEHEAWGLFVIDQVTKRLKHEISEDRLMALFKAKPSSRLKTIDSALAKQAKKKYAEPKEQMTDLVGARFVVLLKTDIEIVERVIVQSSCWVARKDRNPTDEQDAQPKAFDYQSVHYLVRNTEERDFNGTKILEGATCEVQIRTLLQHAYAELVHDRIYKEEKKVPASVERLVARSMALMETTDEMFCNAVEHLESVNKSRQSWCKDLNDLYQEINPTNTTLLESSSDALELLDTFNELLESANISQIKELMSKFIRGKIHSRFEDDGMFQLPICPAVYWLVKNHPVEIKQFWNVPKWQRDLDQIKADLGMA